jgi:Tol biopolymer transport system component
VSQSPGNRAGCAVAIVAALAVGLTSCLCFTGLLWRQSLQHFGRWERYGSGANFIGCRPSMSPNSAFIVYASPRTGHGDIYRMKPDGSEKTRLTFDPNYEGDPQFSPDGTRIVFEWEEEGIGHIWVMNADGSEQRQLTSRKEYDEGPSFFPDGSKIVFTRRVGDWKFVPGAITSAEIFVMNADGTGQTRLTDNERPDWEASFSPDGRWIVFSVSSNTICRMGLQGENSVELGPGSCPHYSPDSKHIVFLSGGYGREISIMDADGKNRKLLHQSQSYMSSPSYCRGGTHVLFLREEMATGVGMICVIGVEDHKLEEIGRND